MKVEKGDSEKKTETESGNFKTYLCLFQGSAHAEPYPGDSKKCTGHHAVANVCPAILLLPLLLINQSAIANS